MFYRSTRQRFKCKFPINEAYTYIYIYVYIHTYLAIGKRRVFESHRGLHLNKRSCIVTNLIGIQRFTRGIDRIMPRNGTGDDEGYSNRRYKRNSYAAIGESANWKTLFYSPFPPSFPLLPFSSHSFSFCLRCSPLIFFVWSPRSRDLVPHVLHVITRFSLSFSNEFLEREFRLLFRPLSVSLRASSFHGSWRNRLIR